MSTKGLVFLNPVVLAMYEHAPLLRALWEKGFEVVECKDDNVSAVLKEYDALLSKGVRYLDTRCPLAAETAAAFSHPYLPAPIEPVLLHCARDVDRQHAHRGLPLYITTPCHALSALGNALSLPNVLFLTWTAFVERFSLTLPTEKNCGRAPCRRAFFDPFPIASIPLRPKKRSKPTFPSRRIPVS